VNVVWDQRTITFVATSASHVLKFLPKDNDANLALFAAGEASGVRMGLDNISIVCVTPLPVELTDFSGTGNGKFADVHWLTATEHNNDYFILERSTDGYNWDFVTKIAGTGNSTSPIEYNYGDENYFSVVSYYKLKQVDYDGKTTQSNVISIDKLEQDNVVIIFPNPSSDVLNINCGRNSLMNSIIQISDLSGNLVFSKQIVHEIFQTSIGIENFTAGMYFIRITNSAGICSNEMFIKN